MTKLELMADIGAIRKRLLADQKRVAGLKTITPELAALLHPKLDEMKTVSNEIVEVLNEE